MNNLLLVGEPFDLPFNVQDDSFQLQTKYYDIRVNVVRDGPAQCVIVVDDPNLLQDYGADCNIYVGEYDGDLPHGYERIDSSDTDRLIEAVQCTQWLVEPQLSANGEELDDDMEDLENFERIVAQLGMVKETKDRTMAEQLILSLFK